MHNSDVRNKMLRHEQIEVISADGPPRRGMVMKIFDEDNLEREVAQPGDTAAVRLNTTVSPNDIIRKVPS